MQKLRRGRVVGCATIIVAAGWMLPSKSRAQVDPGPVDMSDRESARKWFNTWWPRSYGAPMGFTGNIDTGVTGDISEEFRNQTLLRWNIFRRMAGEQPVSLDPIYSAKAQAAAVLCAANDQLSHSPPTTWKFYTAIAAEGCQGSDLGSDIGPSGVSGLIEDGGENNIAVGHRQHLLNPGLALAGLGVAVGHANTNTSLGVTAVWQNDQSIFAADNNFKDPFVLWPSRGYLPFYLLTGRWSASLPDDTSTASLDLSTARVNVWSGGVLLPTKSFTGPSGGAVVFTIDGTESGGTNLENTYVNGELITGLPLKVEDVTFHVKISNIRVRATGAIWNNSGEYEYDIIGYNPDIASVVKGEESDLVNIATRSIAGSGSDTQIAGFIIKGSSPHKVLIRAGGPYLQKFGVRSVLADPVLTLFANGSPIASNDDWGLGESNTSLVSNAVGAGAFDPYSKDAALVAVLLPGVNYTAQVSTRLGAAGSSIIEVYDADTNADSKLVNISTRSFVGTDENIQIGGFVLRGAGPRKVLIRAGGPYLSDYGVTNVLSDPILSVYKGSNRIAENDDWESNYDDVIEAGRSIGVPQYHDKSKDSAIVLVLEAGQAYTAQVSGKSRAVGNALLEIFALP